MTRLEEQFSEAEAALIGELQSAQTAIDHRSGKGEEVEAIVEERLLRPYLRPDFQIAKGSVVSLEDPDNQSSEIDRIVYDPNDAPPLSQALPLIGGSNPERADLYRRLFARAGSQEIDVPLWLELVAMSQQLVGVVLLFMIGLALRNRFRMK